MEMEMEMEVEEGEIIGELMDICPEDDQMSVVTEATATPSTSSSSSSNPTSSVVEVDDQVDTTLRLGSRYHYDSLNIPPYVAPVVSRRPLPPWWGRGDIDGGGLDTTLRLSLPMAEAAAAAPPPPNNNNNDDDRRRRRKRNRDERYQTHPPLLPVEGLLLQTIQQLRGGGEGMPPPMFLYRKWLEDSDANKDLNRLMILLKVRLLNFLTAEEAADLNERGLELTTVGADARGRVYEKAVLMRWGSLNKTVIRGDWRKLTAANNAVKGDVVEVWGYRDRNGKPYSAEEPAHSSRPAEEDEEARRGYVRLHSASTGRRGYARLHDYHRSILLHSSSTASSLHLRGFYSIRTRTVRILRLRSLSASAVEAEHRIPPRFRSVSCPSAKGIPIPWLMNDAHS